MKSYPMPPDIREKEKIIGGIFTLTQGLWIGLGVVVYLVNSLLLSFIFGKFSFFLSIPYIVLGFVFALKKLHEMSLFTYLKYKQKYKKKNKELPNRRY